MYKPTKMDQIKITKKLIELFAMERGLSGVIGAPGIRFQVLVAKNLKSLSGELDRIREKSKYTAEFQAVLDELDQVKQPFVTRDDSGKPQISEDGRTYVIHEDNMQGLITAVEQFWAIGSNLQERQKHDLLSTEYENYIHSQTHTLDLYKIPSECIPEKHFEEERNSAPARDFIYSCVDLIA